MHRQIVIMLLGLMTTLSLPAFAIAGSRESSHATQPYKYIGKELDRTHGLDWYDHGARHYDPVTGRWDVMDALAEKYYPWSPYVSCGDDPVNTVDPNGMAPGDIFTSADLAATDFGKYYNPRSIRESKEYASSIYKIIGRNGIIGFSYTFANKGNGSECSPSLPTLYEVVADAHTHGASSVNSEKNTMIMNFLA